jgi:hypothetical protein
MADTGKASSAAHSVLQYVITKALLEGKTYSTNVKIPITDIVDEYEEIDIAPDAKDLVLVVNISSEWSSGNSDVQVELLEDEDDGI